MSEVLTIKSIRYHGNQDVRVDQIPVPTNALLVGEVRLAPAWVGVCGTDVAEYVEGPVFIPRPNPPNEN